jgi:GR25 family glycosyltransferase involved in LPS biosynthesis
MSIIYVLQTNNEFMFNEHLRSFYKNYCENNNQDISIKKIIISCTKDLSKTKYGVLWDYVFKNNFIDLKLEFNTNFYKNFNFEQQKDIYYFIINDNVKFNNFKGNFFNSLVENYKTINSKVLYIPKYEILFLSSLYIYTLLSCNDTTNITTSIAIPYEYFDFIKITKKLNVALHVNSFTIRGSEIALYDYACYITTLLGHNAIIVAPTNHKEHVHPNTGFTYDSDIEDKFRKSFEIYEYTELNQTLENIGADIFYVLKSGEKDNFVAHNIPSLIHCVFICNDENKHGDVYACISENINYCNAPVVPHICHNLPKTDEKLFSDNSTYIFGCYGGYEAFDIDLVHNTIKKVVEERDDITFLFMNIKKFIEHKQVKFFDKKTGLYDKSKFINSCTAMIHGRSIGESFGMSIAEFTTLGKPIITWKHDGLPNKNEDLHHIDVLKDSGIYYKDSDSLYEILTNFSKYEKPPLNYADIFSPHIVMDKFNKYFIEPFNKQEILLNIEENKDINKVYNIKVLCNWTTTEQVHKTWTKLIGDFPVNFVEEEPDYWIIINKPPENSFYIKEKTIVLGMEPDTFFSERWKWYGDKNDYFYFMDEKYRSNTEWWLDMDLLDLENISPEKTKEKIISSVVSSQYIYEGHKLRIDFLKEAEKELDFDIFGWDNSHCFQSYRGSLLNGKNDGLFPYKYTFIAENVSKENFCTEKFVDAILSECLIFYWGCTNIDDFFDPLCYVKLDLRNITKSIRKIRQTIMSNQWEKRIEVIRKMKHRIIRKYSFIPRILGLIKVSELEKRTVNLEKRQEKWLKHLELCKEAQIHNITRFNAIDGNQIDINKLEIPFSLTQNFSGNKNTGAIIGCACSHYYLWLESIKLNKTILIMEDDVEFCDQFVDRLSFVMDKLRDVMFIGFHDHEYNLEYNNLKPDFLLTNFTKTDIVSFDFIKSYANPGDAVGLTGGGTFGYLISPKGAAKLVNCVNKHTFYFPVDYFMLESGLHYNLELDFIPHRLITSPKFGIDTNESDIQRN